MAVAAVAAGALRIGSMFARGAGSVLSGGARGVGRSGGMLRRAVLKKSKVKRENIARSRSFNKKLIERNKRRQKEKTIETFSIKKPRLGRIPGKSFFKRILDFIGTLFLGWLFNNLPKIIKFVQDLIKRINLLIDSLKSFVKNLGSWFTALKDNIVARFENIKSFDFTDQSGKIKKSMDDLEKAFIGMSNDFDNAQKAITGDISGETSGEVTGESGPISGGESAIAKQMYDYLMTKEGMTENKAEGIVANIKFESGFRPGVASGDDGGSGGLFQMKAERGIALQRAVPNWKTNWKGQIDHALQTDRGPEYMGKNFSSGGDAANWFMRNYERPSEGLRNTRDVNQRQWLKKANLSGEMGGSGGKYGGGGGNVVEYITGDRRHPNFEYNGHGRESNYHEHIAFKTLQDKERAKAALRAAGIQVGSEYRPGDPGWHGANLAIDVPGAQWGGSGAIGQREYNGSARVRQVLSNAGFGGAGLGHGSSAISRSPGVMPDIGYSTGPQNTMIIIEEEAPPPQMMGQSGGSSPTIVMGASLNSIMKRKLLTDLAYT